MKRPRQPVPTHIAELQQRFAVEEFYRSELALSVRTESWLYVRPVRSEEEK